MADNKPANGILHTWASLLYRRRKLILLSWIVLLGIAVANLALNRRDLTETELRGATGTEAWEVTEILEQQFGSRLGNSAALVVDGQTDSEALRRELLAAIPTLHKVQEVRGRTPHAQQLFYLEYRPDLRVVEAQTQTATVRAWLNQWSARSGLKTYLTGNTAFQQDAKDASKKDSARGEGLALLISLGILIATFGALTSALLPLLMGASTLVGLNSLGLVLGLPVNPVSRILTSLVGLALAIDYSLFLVSRYREELKAGSPPAQALRTTVHKAGNTVLFSALIMMVSLSVLLIPDVSLSRTVVSNMLLVIALSLANTLIVLPALLALGQRWLEWPQVLSRGIARFDTERFWRSFADHITRYPRSYFVLSLTILLGLALPVTQMRLWEPVQAIAPRNSESMAGYRLLEQDGWGGELIPVTLVVKAPPGQTVYEPPTIAYVDALTTALRAQPAVADVQSLTTWQPHFTARDYQAFFSNWQTLGALLQPRQFAPLVNVDQGSTLTLVQVFPKDLMALDDTQTILNFSRAYARTHPAQPLLTGGAVARVKDFTHELYRPLPLMLFLVLGGIYALLLAYMRTPVLPAKAAIMNFLPILSAFGLLTLVFQHGWLSGLLHTPINGAVTNIVPIVLFCIIFGLSMDYEVLILSRISERYEAHGQVRKAVVEGLSRSGSVITGAVLILLGVFVPGIFSSSPQTQEICLGISAAILLDATVVRLLLVPSFMMLLGKWNWWRPGARS